jgi:hypothetical protein
VQLALQRIEAAGIMGHVRRGLVVAGRWCQWTNAYLFVSSTLWASQPCNTEARSAEVSIRKKKHREKAEAGQNSAERNALAAKWGLLSPA